MNYLKVVSWFALPRTSLALAALAITLPLLAVEGKVESKAVHLSSAETALTIEAGPESPRLVQLVLVGGRRWENQGPESLIGHVEVGGKTRRLHWRFNPAASQVGPALVRLVYDSASPHLRVSWEWRVRARHGPLEHSILIRNMSDEELWLPLQASFRFDWHVAAGQSLEQFWVEKGAGRPSEIGTHTVNLNDGYRWTGESSTYAHPAPSQAREIIPYLLVEDSDGKRSGWYAGIEFSGRTRMTLERQGESLRGEAGLNPEPAPFRTRLAARAAFATPTIFLGAFPGGPDAAGNILRRWVREVLGNPLTTSNLSYPLLVMNTWGSGMDIGEAASRRMIREAAKLGLEMFHLDAGWFRGVGDWYPDLKKFPSGLAPLADDAHRRGLKFGLWVDWAQAGPDKQPGALSLNDPQVRDWLTIEPAQAGAPREPFKGVTIDIGIPAAHDWVAREIDRLVRDDRLDMLEHDGYLVAQGCIRTDHPHVPPDGAIRQYVDSGFTWAQTSNETDVSYHATRAYYDIYARLRRAHPGLLLEICNDGGRMVDFGSAAHGDYFSITDAYDPLSNRRAFYDSSYVLPPAMLESYVEKWNTPHIENFRYMLRSGMMGWFSLMMDPAAWTEEQHAAAREAFALYKSRLRPLIRHADLYHVSARPDGVHWDGVEYFDPARRQGVLFAFRGSAQEEQAHTFVLQGLRPNRSYRLHFQDHSSNNLTVSGEDLMGKGVQVSLPAPNSSELVFFQEP